MEKEIHKLIINRLISAAVILLLSLSALAGNDDFRRRAHQSSNVDAQSESDVQAEIQFGRSVAARILGRFKLHDDIALQKYIELVGQSLARNSTRSELDFHFAVLASDDINAYSTPGGYVFITSGALRMMQDEAELAAVLAHEIAHISRRHIVNELNIRGTEASTSSGLARIMGGGSDTLKVAFMQTVDKAVAILFESGFKQADENDADLHATLLLAHTGYDPAALMRYLMRVDKHLKKPGSQRHVTHPPSSLRIQKLAGLIQERELVNVGFPDMKERFSRHVRAE